MVSYAAVAVTALSRRGGHNVLAEVGFVSQAVSFSWYLYYGNSDVSTRRPTLAIVLGIALSTAVYWGAGQIAEASATQPQRPVIYAPTAAIAQQAYTK